MQSAMDRLTGTIERRRWVVIALWLVLLAAATPFALRQTDNLTSGGSPFRARTQRPWIAAWLTSRPRRATSSRW